MERLSLRRWWCIVIRAVKNIRIQINVLFRLDFGLYLQWRRPLCRPLLGHCRMFSTWVTKGTPVSQVLFVFDYTNKSVYSFIFQPKALVESFPWAVLPSHWPLIPYCLTLDSLLFNGLTWFIESINFYDFWWRWPKRIIDLTW